ncbi:repeat domain (List_Bact_rpt), partial [Sarcina sp. DSM 11001]
MSKLSKRITAMLLSGMLVIGSAPCSVFAASTDVDPGQTSEIAEEMFTEDTSEELVAGGETSEIEDTSEAPASTADLTEEASAEEEAQYYTVTLDANGGYFENEWDDSIGDYAQKAEVINKLVPVDGTVAAIPVFTDQEGQAMLFAGWSLERDGELVSQAEEGYVPVDSCVLYAVWQAEDVAIGEIGEQEVADEGTEQADSVQELEEVYAAEESADAVTSEENPVEEDEVTDFTEDTSDVPADAGETTESEDISGASASTGDITEEASGEEAEEVQYYTVTLNANGGYFENEWDDAIGDYAHQAEVVEKYIPVDGTVAAFPVFVDPDGRTMIFAGWSLERDGELVTMGDEEYAPVDNCVLYAVWQAADEYTMPDSENEQDAASAQDAAYSDAEEEETSEGTSDSTVAEEETNLEPSEEEETVKEEPVGEQAEEVVEEQVDEPDKEQDEDSQGKDSLEETVDIDQDEAGEQINEDASAATVPIATSESYRSGPYYTKLCNTLDQYAGASQKERFVQIALSQKGYKASTKAADGSVDLSGNGNALGGYCEFMHIINPSHFGDEWCAAFVSWCGRMAGLPEALLPTTAAARDFRDKGSSYGTVHKLWSEDYSTYIDYQPKKGDIVLLTPTPDLWNQGFRWNKSAHVAIVSEDATTRNSDGGWIFKTIERGGDYNSATTSETVAGNTVGSRTASTKKMRNEGYPWFQMIITPNWEDTGGSDTQTPRVHDTLPVDMGEEFYAYIRNQSHNAYLTNQLNNIGGEEFTGNSRQIWRFNKQSNGAYSISSVYDNACMDVLGIT